MDFIEDFRLQQSQEYQAQLVSDSIFVCEKIDWESRLSNKQAKTGSRQRRIITAAISNGVIVLGLNACTILRWRLQSSSKEAEEIEILSKSDDAIERLFLDPSGYHCIVGLKSGDLYYLHLKVAKAKKLSKLQGCLESAAFDSLHTTESFSKSFLVGTSLGYIYEISLDSAGKEKVFQVVYQMDIPLPITSIYFELFNQNERDKTPTMNSLNDDRLIILFATTSPNRLYYVVGGTSFQQLFIDAKETNLVGHTELPGDLIRNELHTYFGGSKGKMKNFALMTSAGIYHGSTNCINTNDMFLEAHLLPYPVVHHLFNPLSMSVTEFHFLVLSNDRLQALSALNGDLVQEEIVSHLTGQPIGLVCDTLKSVQIMFSQNSLFQIVLSNEDRNVWSIYLNKAIMSGDDSLFDSAYLFAKSQDHKRMVNKARAEHYYSNGLIDKAAAFYAKSGLLFEDVALKLVFDAKGDTSSFDDYNLKYGLSSTSLRVYLDEVLKLLPTTMKSQRTMISTWLCEAYLHQISLLDKALCSVGNIELQHEDLIKQFQSFLRQNRQVLDVSTVVNLLVSRNRRKLLLFFARLSGDYHRVVGILLTSRKYSEVISVLMDAPTEKIEQFIYKICPVLMENEPEKTINLLLKKMQLCFSALLPSITRYCSNLDNGNVDSSEINYSIRYVEELLLRGGININPECDAADIDASLIDLEVWMASGLEAIVIHTMVWLLTKYDKTERKLCSLLSILCELRELGVLEEVVAIDPDHILRQCRKFHRKKGCVFAHLLLKNPAAAMRECVLFDTTLSRKIAKRQKDLEVQKSLWIIFATYILSNEADPRTAVSIINDSEGIVTVEDLLTILPDFTEIDFIQAEISGALQNSSVKISAVKDDMNKLASSIESTIQELDEMKNKHQTMVSKYQKCELCLDVLLGRQFYLFPCSHGFHSECLIDHSPHYLTPVQLSCLQSIQISMKSLLSKHKEIDGKYRAQIDVLQEELDDCLASDCPLCGYAVISLLPLPLVSDVLTEESKLWV